MKEEGMVKDQQPRDNLDTSLPKKENPPKEKKVKPKYYAGTNVEILPRVPKKYLADLEKVDALTPEQLEKYYTAVILGIIPDRFGMEVSIDAKLKAAKGLTEIRENRIREQQEMVAEQQEVFAVDFVLKQKIQADEMLKNKEEDEEDDGTDNDELSASDDLL